MLFWCKVICETVLESLKDNDIVTLSRITAIFSARIFSSESDRLTQKTFNLLITIWKDHPVLLSNSLDEVLEMQDYQVS